VKTTRKGQIKKFCSQRSVPTAAGPNPDRRKHLSGGSATVPSTWSRARSPTSTLPPPRDLPSDRQHSAARIPCSRVPLPRVGRVPKAASCSEDLGKVAPGRRTSAPPSADAALAQPSLRAPPWLRGGHHGLQPTPRLSRPAATQVRRLPGRRDPLSRGLTAPLLRECPKASKVPQTRSARARGARS